MKIPIPDDWSGEWSCIQIEWPDSVIWRAILLGMIDQMSAGRLWDERSGSIHAIQAIGREIWQRNIELTPCSGDEPFPAPTPEQIFVYGGGDDEECDEMGCAPCIRWNAGILEIFVCGEWTPVPGGSPSESPIETPEGEIGDPETPQPGDSETVDIDVKCRAAYALARAMWRVHARVIDYVDDVFAILDIGNKVSSDLPEYTLTKYHISMMATTLIAASATIDLDIVFADESSYVADMSAWLMKFMPTRYSLNRAQYEALAAGLLSYSFHEGVEINLGQFLEGDYWRQCWWALGPGTVNDIMAASRTMDADEFDCHERVVYTEPPADFDIIWTTFVEELQTLPNGQDGAMTSALTNNRHTLGITWAGTSSSGSTDNTSQFGMDCAVNIKTITLRFAGNPPTEEWDSGSAINWSNIQHGAFVSGGVGETWVETVGASYVDWTCTFDTACKPSKWGYNDSHSARWLGQSAPNPFTRDHTVTIQSYTTT